MTIKRRKSLKRLAFNFNCRFLVVDWWCIGGVSLGIVDDCWGIVGVSLGYRG